MKDILPAVPAVFVIVGILAFAFAVVMQPVFVWMICARLKRTNQILSRIENKPQHNALVTPNVIHKPRP